MNQRELRMTALGIAWVPSLVLLAVMFAWSAASGAGLAETFHVWEKVEITLHADMEYANSYTDVDVWVDLEGPGFRRRCHGFWDGGDVFRVRVMAVAPGRWTWHSGCSSGDSGLSGASGAFQAVAWRAAEKEENPCRRGTIRATENGHAFEYADGAAFFLTGDTWWAVPTFRFRWHDDDTPRPLGPDAGFKDFVRFRKKQQYNCIALIAALPNWANDDKPARFDTDEGIVLRRAWPQAGTDSAKDMMNEAGERAFQFPGRVPDYEDYFPDVERINPAYFQMLDKKIDYLNAQGMVPFIEVARRDVGQSWKEYYPWPESYARYIQYVWSRYQANICLYSPIHFDTPAHSIPAKDWNEAANFVLDKYGKPPFGTLAGTNSNPSSLRNWGHVEQARWLDFHQVGNRRTHDLYPYLTEIFQVTPPVPGINGEPYYDGMEDADGGTEKSALYCRSAMYGSVLSGGLGGHIYGAGGWKGGIWSGEVEAASQYPIWDVVQWSSADQMRHLKTFILSRGKRYQDLVPHADLLAPNRSGTPKSLVGWAYCSCTGARDLFFLYFEKDCPRASVSQALPTRTYQAHWYNPRNGRWLNTQPGTLLADANGRIVLPSYPDGKLRSDTDWAMRLVLGSGLNPG